MKKHKKKCELTNKQAIMLGVVKYQCKERGIDIEPLNLSWPQIEELYNQLTKGIRDRCYYGQD